MPEPSPLMPLEDERLSARLWLKRDDLIHPVLVGNKWRKLELNLAAVGRRTVLTFGGAYSNHIRATAAAGRMYGFPTIGVIRGEEHLPLNESLAGAVGDGMFLTYMDRETYRRKNSPDVIARLRNRFGDFYLLPEGGSNELAVRGCARIPAEISEPFDVICCPVGTGGTLAGIAAGLDSGQRAVGFSALKGAVSLESEVAALQERAFGSRTDNWRISHEFHFGGFARTTDELEEFIRDFRDRHGIELERCYVAKMMFGVLATRFEPGTRVVAVISG
ncbi:MAG TPA: pyridoxal-phosphate dependent enzyme [Mycobacteriales bacterium]|nr:pyridoxal-phosphate dependent enzyme [Mycobacteriales bacterium]